MIITTLTCQIKEDTSKEADNHKGGGAGGGPISPFSAIEQNVLFPADDKPIVTTVLNQQTFWIIGL